MVSVWVIAGPRGLVFTYGTRSRYAGSPAFYDKTHVGSSIYSLRDDYLYARHHEGLSSRMWLSYLDVLYAESLSHPSCSLAASGPQLGCRGSIGTNEKRSGDGSGHTESQSSAPALYACRLLCVLVPHHVNYRGNPNGVVTRLPVEKSHRLCQV